VSRVLVTGAGGFIGSHLTQRLVEDGHRVRAFVRYNSQNNWGCLDALPPSVIREVEVHRGDLKDPEAVRKAVEGSEVVYHLGAVISIPYSYVNPLDLVQTNVLGTANVLNACLSSKSLVRLVHTSTSEVYGTARFTPITEEHPLQAQSPYSASKIAADKLAESYHRSFGLPVAIIRPFNTFGPRQSSRAIISSIIVQALHGEDVRVGSLDPVRDFCFVADTVSGFLAVASAERSVGRVLNIGTGTGISMGRLVRIVLKMMDSKAEVVVERSRMRPEESEVMELVCDASQAKTVTGWTARVSLETGLSQTIAWMRENRQRYKPEIYNF
jgi:dTDP-glucose 4,6-dehydratase